jgi:hypothetical protein
MITCAVSVADEVWKAWFEAVGNMKAVRDLECSAAVLAAGAEPMALARRLGLRMAHARDLLPPDMARYLTESPARGREDVLACLKKALALCHGAGVSSVCLQLGLDRIGDATFQHDLGERVRLLRALIPDAERLKLTVCVRVRYPRAFPGSKEWEHAGSLVHEVMHPCCRLALDLVPAELTGSDGADAVLRAVGFNTGLIRLHYQPAAGEQLDPASQARWATALNQHGFKGGVVYCPRVTSEEAIRGAAAQIDAWAAAFAPGPAA